MPTISAYTSDRLAQQVAEVSQREGRKVAQLSSDALALYVALGEAGRQALADLNTKAPPDVRAQAIDQAVRTLIKANFDRMDAEFVAAHPDLSQRFSSMSEEELDTMAIQAGRPVPR